MNFKTAPWHKFSKASPVILAAGLALATVPTAHAQTLYSDSYSTVTTGTDLAGRSPNVDLTGATYVTRNRGQGNPNGNATIGNPAGSANTNGNGAAGLSLASGGTFTRVANASTFTISADLSLGGIAGSGTAANAGTSTRGVELGFYSAPFAQGTFDANEGFTGFALQNNGAGGILQFVAAGGSTGLSGLTLTGTLSTTAFYNLTFTVNTATGNLTSVIFNGTNVTSSFTTGVAGAFTDAATAFAGFGASSTTGGTTGNVDNFSVVNVVPEPGTWAMALVGIGALLGLQRFRARKA